MDSSGWFMILLWKDGAMRFVVTSIWNIEVLLSTGMEFSNCFHNIPFKIAIFEQVSGSGYMTFASQSNPHECSLSTAT
jgi:hypothetical protein